jgi:hypothetical protein
MAVIKKLPVIPGARYSNHHFSLNQIVEPESRTWVTGHDNHTKMLLQPPSGASPPTVSGRRHFHAVQVTITQQGRFPGQDRPQLQQSLDSGILKHISYTRIFSVLQAFTGG